MRQMMIGIAAAIVAGFASNTPSAAGLAGLGAIQQIDLGQRLSGKQLRPVNREITPASERQGVHVSERAGPGVVWVEGTDFADGTIEVDVRGRDVLQQSFVGLAFHRSDDNTYEAVYLRPFNFRAADPARRQNAVQYMAVPEYDWPRLRSEFPSEFENPVDPSIEPTAWVPLRIVVSGNRVQIYAGSVATPALEVRKLGKSVRGAVGLWVGSNSDGDFANLRITPAK
jgi:hypothetical protein